MAYGSSDLTSAETTSFSNDKPMMVVQQIKNPSGSGWREAAGEVGDPDRTAATFPAYRAYDELGSVLTKDTASTDTEKYFILDMGSNTIAFDTLFILGHNFNSVGASTVALHISDGDDFAASGVNTVEIFNSGSLSGTTDTRISCFNLNHAGGTTYSAGGTAKQFTNVRYIRIKVTTNGLASRQLAMGELFLGQRYSLQRNPDIPWNNKDERSLSTDFTSKSGVSKRYVMYRGQATRQFSSVIAADAEISNIEDWFNDIDEGTRPFVYVETPSSSPKPMLCLLDSPVLAFPLNGPFERLLTFGMVEQTPFLSRE